MRSNPIKALDLPRYVLDAPPIKDKKKQKKPLFRALGIIHAMNTTQTEVTAHIAEALHWNIQQHRLEP